MRTIAQPLFTLFSALAPSTDSNHFTNEWKVEAWFDWNCRPQLKHECTSREKTIR